MSLSMNSGVSITPRHFFGVNHEIKNSLFLVDDNTLLYPAGHTVVSNKLHEERAPQYFFPGSEGTEAITNLCKSVSGEYFAMCERAPEGEKGILTIYEVVSSKKMAVLPDDDLQKG